MQLLDIEDSVSAAPSRSTRQTRQSKTNIPILAGNIVKEDMTIDTPVFVKKGVFTGTNLIITSPITVQCVSSSLRLRHCTIQGNIVLKGEQMELTDVHSDSNTTDYTIDVGRSCLLQATTEINKLCMRPPKQAAGAKRHASVVVKDNSIVKTIEIDMTDPLSMWVLVDLHDSCFRRIDNPRGRVCLTRAIIFGIKEQQQLFLKNNNNNRFSFDVNPLALLSTMEMSSVTTNVLELTESAVSLVTANHFVTCSRTGCQVVRLHAGSELVIGTAAVPWGANQTFLEEEGSDSDYDDDEQREKQQTRNCCTKTTTTEILKCMAPCIRSIQYEATSEKDPVVILEAACHAAVLEHTYVRKCVMSIDHNFDDTLSVCDQEAEVEQVEQIQRAFAHGIPLLPAQEKDEDDDDVDDALLAKRRFDLVLDNHSFIENLSLYPLCREFSPKANPQRRRPFARLALHIKDDKSCLDHLEICIPPTASLQHLCSSVVQLGRCVLTRAGCYANMSASPAEPWMDVFGPSTHAATTNTLEQEVPHVELNVFVANTNTIRTRHIIAKDVEFFNCFGSVRWWRQSSKDEEEYEQVCLNDPAIETMFHSGQIVQHAAQHPSLVVRDSKDLEILQQTLQQSLTETQQRHDALNQVLLTQNAQHQHQQPCIVCHSQPPTLALVPCGHRVLCAECFTQLPYRRCPLCQTTFQSSLLVYN